jgi:hypothetical protein
LTDAFADPVDAAFAEHAEPDAEPALLRRKPGQAARDVLAGEADRGIQEQALPAESAIKPLDLSMLDLGEEPAPFLHPTSVIDAAPQEPAQLEVQPEPDAPEADHAAREEAQADPPVFSAAPMIAATPQLPASFRAELAEMSDASWSPVAGAPLESLGLVQLIERLALAIAARNTASEAAAAAPVEEALPEPAPITPDFVPGPFSRPHIVPAAAPDDAPASGSAREAILRRLGAIAAGDADVSDQQPRFERPARLVPAASETLAEPATAVAPDQRTAVPFETDEALRSALATLQRMTARG